MHEKQQWRWILFHLLHEILREVFIRDLRVHSMTSCYLIWAWVAESMENLGKTQIEQSRKIVKTRETYLDCMDETVQWDWLQYRWFGKEWYFVTKIALTYYEKKIVLVIKIFFLKFEIEGQEFSKFLKTLEQFIQTVQWKLRTTFGNRMLF